MKLYNMYDIAVSSILLMCWLATTYLCSRASQVPSPKCCNL